MRDGEAIKRQVFVLGADPLAITAVPVAIPKRRVGCCDGYSYSVFASTADSNIYSNDTTFFNWSFDVEQVISAVLTLQKWSAGAYEDLVVLENNDLGINFKYPFFQDDLGNTINSNGEAFSGYQMDWRKVIIAHGSGSYKVKLDAVSLMGSGMYVSDEYCLKEYSAKLADGSVRIDMFYSGELGDIYNNKKRRDYGTINGFHTLRLPGYFTKGDSDMEQEFAKYDDIDGGIKKANIKNEQDPVFTIQIKPIPVNKMEVLRTDFMQLDEKYVTNYNSNYYYSYLTAIGVSFKEGFKPEIKPQLDMAPVKIDVVLTINNNKRYQ